MRWLESFTFLMRSSITTIREQVEDPERMLHQLIIDMDEELELIRRNVAEAIADEIGLGKRAQKARGDADEWIERAMAALQRGDENASKAALEQKLTAEQRAESLESEYQNQKEQTARLQRAVLDLEDKIRQARQKRTLLLARLSRADSSRRINEALDHVGSRSAFAQFSRLEERVERAEALSEARDRMDGRDPEAEELKRKFDEDDRKRKLQEQFEALKARLADQQSE